MSNFSGQSSTRPNDKPAICHEDEEVPVADGFDDADVGAVDDVVPEAETLAVSNGARVEREDGGKGASFKDFNEVGESFGIVNVFGAMDSGKGVGVFLEVLGLEDGALALGDGEVAEAGVEYGVAGYMDFAGDMFLTKSFRVVAGGSQQKAGQVVGDATVVFFGHAEVVTS